MACISIVFRSSTFPGNECAEVSSKKLTERMVENTRCVDHLPTQVFVIRVTDVQRFGCKRVRLYFDIGARHLVQETRLAHVGVAADE